MAKPPLSSSLHSGKRLPPRKFIDRVRTQVQDLGSLPAIEQDIVSLCHDSASLEAIIERAKYGTMPQNGQYLCNSAELVDYLQISEPEL